MKKIHLIIVFIYCFLIQTTWSQSVNIEGKVYGTADIEGIHVINKSQKKATITDSFGAFIIKAKENDTLVFSAVQYKLESIFVDREMIKTRLLKVFLLEDVNQLDEVVVGKVMTGNLGSDIENSDAKPDINFYDVGIPGYKGKIKTQSERRVVEADHGKFIYYYGVGLAINVNKILNRVSGRTKDLKNRVKLEFRDELMFKVKAKFSENLFKENPMGEQLHYEFFYFCSEDPDFIEQCDSYNDLQAMSFLHQKLSQYKTNLKN